ncbi:MAG: hypothetical protein HQ553_14680 [Chloroflexi bacterium]|nr:hypothetical protein [Chloroflexota bacterium]
MTKLSPEERWKKEVMERYKAFMLSEDLERLRSEGLAILGRTQPISSEEWGQISREGMAIASYRDWYEECRLVGERFGLAQWTVQLACLLEGFDPEDYPMVLEADWPTMRVVTRSTNSVFLQHIAWHAQKLGLYAVQRDGSLESALLNLGPEPSNPLESADRPPSRNAFSIRVETPTDYPSEAAAQLNRKAAKLGKELRKRLGYKVRERLRSSPLVEKAAELNVEETPLGRGGTYDIIDEMYPGEDMKKDKARRKTTGSQRHRVRKRLIERYEE